MIDYELENLKLRLEKEYKSKVLRVRTAVDKKREKIRFFLSSEWQN